MRACDHVIRLVVRLPFVMCNTTGCEQALQVRWGTALGVIDDSVFTDVRDVRCFRTVQTDRPAAYISLEIYFLL